ncbi:hypothetical protein O1611_g666 [Lasiodiplodia mahajangana]|uniref:Uncharacterized protein n=1 Tax=Lasiodiplodia mahajangana TaxID=1108764 RepID=A0ACC2JZK1_9PEZI|nr:hypothetical protein O1611_g666 [Lasiodiplodia mahajangana]
MYFTKSISTFVIGALLATSAVGELTKVPRGANVDIAAREQANAIRALTPEERIQKRADDCLSAIKKRRLLARDNKNVGVDDWASGKGQDQLTTSGLATCYGVAITGSYEGDNSGDDRFLSHALEGERGPAESLFDAVEEAIKKGLGNIYALLVYPDPTSFTDADGWTDEDRSDIQAEHDWYVMWISDATGGVAPEEKSHSYKESWGIKINSFKGIQSGQFVG